MSTPRAIVLAGGLGTRMRAPDSEARLTEDQRRVADAGLKSMIPVNGRPFLDFLISAIADAGVSDVGLIVAPDHEPVRRRYTSEAPPARATLTFIVQEEAIGTANAVLTAEEWTTGEPFLVMNADNLYPPRALRDLAALDEPGLPAFDRDDLVRSGNIPRERLNAFAVVELDDRGYLTRIVEKPSGGTPPGGALISMNCWRFDSRIFAACRDVPRSARGEFELPEAVGLAVARGVRFRALRATGPVLDLSRRADAVDIAQRLAGVVPRP